jgi:hypothetical protein
MGDTTGNDGATAQASNPASVDSDGDFSITNTAPQSPTNSDGSLNAVGVVVNAIAKLFGITGATAQGAQVMMMYSPSFKPLGFLTILSGPKIVPGTNLAAALIQLGAKIQSNGNIVGPDVTGQINGFSTMPNAALGITVYDFAQDAVDLDNPDISTVLNGTAGGPVTIGTLPAHVWLGLKTIGGAPIQRPAQRTWSGVGVDNSDGRPLINMANIFAACSRENSWLLPDYIGGKDPTIGGIYDMRQGKRVVPDNETGRAGWSIGPSAAYIQGLVLLGWTAQGRYVLLGSYAEAINVLDPTTGLPLNIAGYTYMRVYWGSQQINLCPALESVAYNGQVPGPTFPSYGSTIAGAPGIVGVSNAMVNTAILSQTAYQILVNPGENPGGPEGPGEGEDDVGGE